LIDVFLCQDYGLTQQLIHLLLKSASEAAVAALCILFLVGAAAAKIDLQVLLSFNSEASQQFE